MSATQVPRRTFVKQSLAATAPMFFAAGALPVAAAAVATSKRLRIVCVGGHPDDPESGCAGTLARYADAGHTVTILYLTRGERGIRDKSNEEAAAIRSAECAAACKIIGARPLFAGQIDGATEMTHARVDEFHQLLAAETPDVLFTHWPIDTHFDHQVASLLTIRSYLALAQSPHLFFFEVNTGSQTQGFFPNTYVDITTVVERKKSALFAHVSQDGVGIWRQHHEVVAAFRGREAGVKAAEAFVHLNRDSRTSPLPGL